MTRPHVPVLAGELVEALDPAPGSLAVDCTFGAGGHARLLAQRLGPAGEIVCIDRDPQAEEHFTELASEVACATRFIAGNYADVLPALHHEGLQADLLYMDLGISSMQVDAWERGFSYSYDAPLDMRMDTSQELDARTILNEWPEGRLAATIREYGEERYARRIAREIVRRRERAPVDTTTELVEAIKRAVPTPAQFAGGHPARRTFQAIRIAVNDELGSLERALPAAWELLRPGGRMAVIAFHSLEDRLVKRFFVELARGCVCPPELPVCVCGHEPEAELVTRRPVRPSEGEIADNPRSGSGRLRAAIKLAAGSETSAPERSGS
jgi:16S rRNA (cytosine1402-N4)-methyltransferase